MAVDVILKVLADTGQRVLDRDTERHQLFGRTDAREHQQLRRVDRAARDDDLARARFLSLSSD